MGLVGVAVPAGTGVGRHGDVLKFPLGLYDRFLAIKRIDQHVEIARHMLALLDQHIMQMRIHADVGIRHRLTPHRLFLGRQLAGRAARGMHGGEMVHEIAEGVQHAARILFAEAAEFAVGAARIVGKDRLELRRLLAGEVELLGGESADADHPDIAVAPGLLRDPGDDVVAVPFARAAVSRLEVAARRADHMHITARYEEFGITCFRVAEPQRRPGRLRRKTLRQFGSLQLLGMNTKSEENRKPAGDVRAVDIERHLDAVAHRHRDVLVANDPLVLRRPLIVRRRLMAGRKNLLGRAGVVVFHWPPTITHINSAGSRPVLSQEWPTPRCTTASKGFSATGSPSSRTSEISPDSSTM